MEQMSMFGCPTAYRSSRITRQTRRESNEKDGQAGDVQHDTGATRERQGL